MELGVIQPDLSLGILFAKRLRHCAPELRLRMENRPLFRHFLHDMIHVQDHDLPAVGRTFCLGKKTVRNQSDAQRNARPAGQRRDPSTCLCARRHPELEPTASI